MVLKHYNKISDLTDLIEGDEVMLIGKSCWDDDDYFVYQGKFEYYDGAWIKFRVGDPVQFNSDMDIYRRIK